MAQEERRMGSIELEREQRELQSILPLVLMGQDDLEMETRHFTRARR